MPKVILLLSIKTTQVCEYSYGTLFRNNEILATCPLSTIFKCIFDPLTYTSSKKSFPDPYFSAAAVCVRGRLLWSTKSLGQVST